MVGEVTIALAAPKPNSPAPRNRNQPSILIFDGDFIRRNVHATDEVIRDNKRQLLRVIVGATGVRLDVQGLPHRARPSPSVTCRSCWPAGAACPEADLLEVG